MRTFTNSYYDSRQNGKFAIERGDRIYVRIMQDGQKMLEMSVDNVGDMTELIGEIRYAGQRLEGLMKLFIRNHNRGWSVERPMRFYTGVPSPRRSALRQALQEASVALQLNAAPRHMPFPWETH